MKKEILDRLVPVTEEEQAILDGNTTIDRDLYMSGVGNTVNSRKLLASGKLITVRPHTRFVEFPEHTHDYVEVIYMCTGSTTHIVNSKRILLRQGELLFLNQHARQKILKAGREDVAVNFIVLPQFFDSALAMIGDEESPLRKFIIECLREESSSAGYLHFRVADVLPVQNLVENLLWTLIHDTPNKRKINQNTMALLFVHLLNCTDRLVYDSPEEEAILKIFRYVEENYQSGSLTEAARLFHYDFSWLSREIKRKSGKTYTEIVQDKRLSQAAFLLKNTNMNVSDISLSVGYDNMSYFHRIFAKRYGTSPKKYRDCK